ncbi:MAG: hypothetical protein JRG71_14795 [Deltaproteobacteria bacterium]|nr:hypothetical protein [Deltaproteobacteria bacterium]
MGFLELFNLASNSEFKKRVQIAIIKTATAVIGEDEGLFGQAATTKRHALGVTVLNSPANQASLFAKHMVSGGNILAELTTNEDGSISITYTGTGTLDQDIEYLASQLWNDRAGVTNVDIS